MEDLLPLVGKAAAPAGHHALSPRGADRGAEGGLAAEARLTPAAFRGVERDDMVTDGDRSDARSYLAHDSRAFVAEHAGKQPLAIEPVECVGVGVANARRHDLDQHFAGARSIKVELDDLERPLGLERNGSTGLHQSLFSNAPHLG